MTHERRRFLALLGAGVTAGCSAPVRAPGARPSPEPRTWTEELARPNVVWRTRIGGFFDINRPATSPDTVFVQSDASIFALDSTSGDVRWARDIGSQPNFLSPAVLGDSVFATSELRPSGDGRLYALSASTGAVRWTVDGGIVSSPVAEDGRVYVSVRGADTCAVRAVSADDGSDEWTAPLGEGHRCLPSSSPVGYYEDRVFAAVDVSDGGAGSGTLVVLDAEDGTERWRYAVDGRIDTSPVVADGTVFLAASDGGALHAIDLETRTESWSYERQTAGDNYWAPPQVADGRVYAGNIGGVTAFHVDDGTVAWDLRRNLISRNGLSVADGTVYTAGKWLAALAADDGTLRWLFREEGMASTAFSPPAVVDGTAYVGGCLKRNLDEKYFHVVGALR